MVEGPTTPATNGLVDVHVFDWKRLAIALVKASGLHSGIWRVRVSFVKPKDLTVNEEVPGLGIVTYPAQLTAMKGLMLVPDKEVGPLSVDAAIVNPDNRIVLAGSFGTTTKH
jgi:hypothetical protein